MLTVYPSVSPQERFPFYQNLPLNLKYVGIVQKLLGLHVWNPCQTVKKASIVCILSYFMDGVSNFQTFNIVLLPDEA